MPTWKYADMAVQRYQLWWSYLVRHGLERGRYYLSRGRVACPQKGQVECLMMYDAKSRQPVGILECSALSDPDVRKTCTGGCFKTVQELEILDKEAEEET